MTQAIRIARTGGTEVLAWEEVSLGAPADQELRIRHTAVGFNYIDIYHRTGSYPLPLPAGIGVEGVGVVVAAGAGVTSFKAGDRIAYVGGPPGAYAEERMIPAARALKLPHDISDEVAASLTFKGLTVQYLVRRLFKVQRGDTVLFHAAAGGVGSIACQWLTHLGATVIGTVSSDEKAAHAKADGCEHPVVYTREDVVQRVKEITGGQGVSVVYDSVGKDTFSQSLQCLRARGMLVSFGTVSGPTPPLDLAELGAKGSLFVTRASIAHYTADRGELEAAATELFASIAAGILKPARITRYPLREAAAAHADAETGKTSGSIVLIP